MKRLLFVLLGLLLPFLLAHAFQVNVLWQRVGLQDSSGYGTIILPLGDQNADGYADWAVYAHLSGFWPADSAYVEFFHGGNPPPPNPTRPTPRGPRRVGNWVGLGPSATSTAITSRIGWCGLPTGTPSAGSRPNCSTADPGPIWCRMRSGISTGSRRMSSSSLSATSTATALTTSTSGGAQAMSASPASAAPPSTRSPTGAAPVWATSRPTPRGHGDLNGDGFGDWVAITFDMAPHLSVYWGRATPDTVPAESLPASQASMADIVPDVNGDGRDDLVLRDTWNTWPVLRR